MQFPFSCERALSADSEGFAVLDARKFVGAVPSRAGVHLQDQVARIIDDMGQAQGLKAIITTTSRFMASDNRLYFRVSGKTAIGILKVGVKKLFIRTDMGQIKEISPLCVLDFYVHESAQRSGQGRVLFDRMLRDQGVHPERLAYDRPSPKLMGFLRKHFNLNRHVPQNNNFVVFNAYFHPSTHRHSYGPPVTVSKDTFASLGLQIASSSSSSTNVVPSPKQPVSVPRERSPVGYPPRAPPAAQKVASFHLGGGGASEETKKPVKSVSFGGGGFSAIGFGRAEEVKLREMDQKIGRTEAEIARCDHEIKELEKKAIGLKEQKKAAAAQQGQSEIKETRTGPTPGGFDMLYNKRMGYATVYGGDQAGMRNEFASQMKRQMHHGSRPPWATYGTTVGGGSGHSTMYPSTTQSSAYGAHFRKI